MPVLWHLPRPRGLAPLLHDGAALLPLVSAGMNRYLVDEATLRALLDDALFLRTLHNDTQERTARSEAALATAQAILCAPPASAEIDPTKLPPVGDQGDINASAAFAIVTSGAGAPKTSPQHLYYEQNPHKRAK